MFKKMSAIEICHRMAAICQNSADVNLPGPERERFQFVSDKFRDEADTLALVALQHSPEWHIHCDKSETAIQRRVRRIKTSDIKMVRNLLDVPAQLAAGSPSAATNF